MVFFQTMNNCHLQNMKEKQREHMQLVCYSLTPEDQGFLMFTSAYGTNMYKCV